MKSLFFHVDLDAFFASVEQNDNPELKGKPVIVGATPGHRGVVSTCSYEARAFGLHSAMPISEAFRRCPGAVFLPVRMKRYSEVSRKIMGLLCDFTPDMLQISIDEALLDMTGTERLWGDPERAASMIKKKIGDETGLTVSIGASANRYIAKIASGIRKPDGFLYVREGEESGFMRSLSLERLWGAGEKTRCALKKIGISTIADLQATSLRALEAKFGRAGARFLAEAAAGKDPGIFAGESKTRSISGERTFEYDTSDREAVLDVLRMIADDLASRLWSDKLSSSTLGIKLRFDDFTSITRQCTRESRYSGSDEIYADAIGLLDRNWDARRPLRLVGIGLQNVNGNECIQRGLFEAKKGRAQEAQEAILEIQKKGKGRLIRARYLTSRGSSRGDADDE